VIGPLLLGAALLGLTAGLVRLWQRYALHRLSYQRWFEPAHTFPGEAVRLTVQFVNQKLLPVLPVKVEEEVPKGLAVSHRRRTFMRAGRDGIVLATPLGPYETVVRHYQVQAERRGFYRLGTARLSAGDPFGVKEQYREVEPSPGLVVYPVVQPLTYFGLESRRPLGDLATQNALLADPFRVAGTRPYQAGDPLNRIHWGATARTTELQVRVSEPTQGLSLALFVNCWSFDQFWEGVEPSSFERGCSLAASLAVWATDQRIPVGLWANGVALEWSAPLALPLAVGPEGLARLLEGLARLHGGSSKSLPALISASLPGLPAGTALVVITRLVEPELYELLAEVRRRRPVRLFVTGDAVELPPVPGLRVIHVGEEGWHETVGA
jgi:uncharacterized protein (DUF58 family)